MDDHKARTSSQPDLLFQLDHTRGWQRHLALSVPVVLILGNNGEQAIWRQMAPDWRQGHRLSSHWPHVVIRSLRLAQLIQDYCQQPAVLQ